MTSCSSFLETSLDFDRHEVRSLLEKQPGRLAGEDHLLTRCLAVLQLSVEDNLHPKVEAAIRVEIREEEKGDEVKGARRRRYRRSRG